MQVACWKLGEVNAVCDSSHAAAAADGSAGKEKLGDSSADLDLRPTLLPIVFILRPPLQTFLILA